MHCCGGGTGDKRKEGEIMEYDRYQPTERLSLLVVVDVVVVVVVFSVYTL